MNNELITKQYILDNYKDLQFECKDNVQLVRDYLENECGFLKASWKTERYTKLVRLYISSSYVHGSEDFSYSEKLINIYHLIEQKNINVEYTDKGWNYE